ncbi:Vacuolar protein sorting-associated protein 11 [Sorochytrium milnesiophthora]
MAQWKTLPMWDRVPLHMVTDGRAAEYVEQLLSGVDVSASHAATSLSILATHQSGNVHVVHAVPLATGGVHSTSSNLHVESFPVFDSSPVSCIRVVVADGPLMLSSRLRNNAAGQTDILHTVLIFAAGEDVNGAAVIRVISYTPVSPAVASSAASISSRAALPPFAVVRDIKPAPLAPPSGRRKSFGSMSQSSGGLGNAATRDPDNQLGQITAFAVNDPALTNIVIGYASGAVVSLKGDILRDRAAKQKVLVPPNTDDMDRQITGVFFREVEKGSPSLYVVTASSTRHIKLYNSKDLVSVLADIGAKQDCSVVSDTGDLFVCNDEAIYQFSPDGRGPCFVIPGTKTKALYYSSQLVLLTFDTILSRHTMTIYSLHHRYIAYTGHFSDVVKIADPFTTNTYGGKGLVVFAGQEGKAYLIEERDAYDKLDVAIKKELFPLALSLAAEESARGNVDSDVVVGVHTKYGDYLYNKSDYDGAMEQYILTVGSLEPSNVIRKFLDAQRVRNLVKYLELLHAKALANADHTTLLLNCYTKNKDVAKLDRFLKAHRCLLFRTGFPRAIRVCRQAGYYTHALALAKRFEQHDMFIRIQVEDVHDYAQALRYMEEELLGNTNLMHEYFDRYGSTLLAHIPEQATEMVIRVLSGQKGQASRAKEAERYVHLFPASQPQWLRRYLEFVVDTFADSCSELVWNTLLEVYLALHHSHDSAQTANPASVRSASPARSGRQASPTPSMSPARSGRERSGRSVMPLLQNEKARYDPNHALTLCQQHHYIPGLLFLYEKQQLYRDILDIYERINDYGMILQVCQQHGGADPTLWQEGLAFLAAHHADPACASVFDAFLAAVQNNAMVSPLQVLQTLAKYPHLTLGHIRSYISGHLRDEKQRIEEDEATAQSYRQETAAMRKEIEELTAKPVMFQVNQCSACGGNLEIPAAHFMCKHSFHLGCLNETEQQCPKCAPQQRTLVQIRKSLKDSAAQPELFYEQLQDADDGYAVIAEWFSKKAILDKIER